MRSTREHLNFRIFHASALQRFLCAFFAFSAAITVLAETGPRIQFASPIFDFGRVQCGQAVPHTFIFTNTGDRLLELKDVRPSCGCTTAGAWDRTVEPGKTGNIPVQFNSANSAGEIGKTVIVLCNDPLQTNIVLQIKGKVWKPVDITPVIASFIASTDSPTNETKRLQLVNNLPEPLELSQPECTNKAFQANLKTITPGKEFELEVTFVPPPGSAAMAAQILLRTTSTNVPVIMVPAHGMVQAAVAATPAQLTLPARRFDSDLQMYVNIHNNGTSHLVLSDPTIEPPLGEVHVQEVQPGRHFILSLNLPAGFQAHPGQTAEIRVKTNHAQFPVFSVPVVAGKGLAATLSASEDTKSPPAKPDPGLAATKPNER